MNVALSELPDFRCLPGKAPADHHTAGIIIAPTLAYMERAYFDARTARLVGAADRRDADSVDARRQPGAARTACRQPVLPARRAAAAGRRVLGPASRRGRRSDDRHRRRARAELQGRGARPTDHEPAGSGADLRTDRRRYLPRRAAVWISCSRRGRCSATATIAARCPVCTCAAPAPIPAAASPARPATTPHAKS